MTFEKTAERRRIGIAEVVTDLLHGQVGTGGQKVSCLCCQVLFDIIAGRQADCFFDDHGEMAWRKVGFFGIESHFVLFLVVNG